MRYPTSHLVEITMGFKLFRTGHADLNAAAHFITNGPYDRVPSLGT